MLAVNHYIIAHTRSNKLLKAIWLQCQLNSVIKIPIPIKNVSVRLINKIVLKRDMQH
jgi:hypothetical protein